MLSALKGLVAKAQTMAHQFNNATFKDGVLSVCALIALADGELEKQEANGVAALIGSSPALKHFDAVDLRNSFLAKCEEAKEPFSRLNLLSNVRALKGNVDQAVTALGIALAIANADGEFEPQEKLVIGELCRELGLDAAAYV